MTPGYSLPEQYGGARTDHRSDIYSLAATLYAAMAGVVPEDSLARTMEQADLTPLRNRNSEVSRRFSKVIEKALAVHPDDRYQTADEFKKALIGTSSSSKRTLAEQGVIDPMLMDASDGEYRLDEAESADPSEPLDSVLVSSKLIDDEFSPKSRPKPNRRRGCTTY